MNIQSKIIISFLLLVLMVWMLRNFINKKLSSGQVLFWFFLLCGAEVLALFPALVDKISILWGNLLPVSWIVFVGSIFFIIYLLYQSTKINDLQTHFTELTRNLTFLEERLRKTESHQKQNSESDLS